MEPPNSYVRIEEVIFTVPIITDREKFESMDMRTFAYQIREMNPDLSINVFTTSSLERLFKAMMLQLDNPQTFCSEQVCAGFSREHTTLVEGAQEKWKQSGSWTACLQELAFQFLLDYKDIMKRTQDLQKQQGGEGPVYKHGLPVLEFSMNGHPRVIGWANQFREMNVGCDITPVVIQEAFKFIVHFLLDRPDSKLRPILETQFNEELVNYFASMEMESLPSFDEQGRDTENAVTLYSGNPNLANQSRLEFSTAEFIPKYKAPKRHRVLSGETQNSATYPKGQAGHNRVIMGSNVSDKNNSKSRMSRGQKKRLKRKRDAESHLKSELDSESEPQHLSEPEPDTISTVPRRLQYTVDPSFRDESTHIYGSEPDSQTYPSSP